MFLNNYIYFKIQQGINSIIRFYGDNFILLQLDIRGKFTNIDGILTLVFSDGSNDIFDIHDTTKTSYIGNTHIGGLVSLYSNYENRFQLQFSPSEVGIVIGTYGSLPHVHLHLEVAKKNYEKTKMLVIDDSSVKSQAISDLCRSYDCEFMTTPNNLGHMRGDVFIVSQAIKWANFKKIPYVYKLSRRFIPLVDIVSTVKDLYKNEFATYSNMCSWGIRSECMLMHTKLWNDNCINSLDDFVQYSSRDGMPHPVPEVLYTKLCKRFYYSISNNNDIVLDSEFYTEKMKRGCIFGILPFLNDNRGEVSANYLWHAANPQSNFYEVSKSLGLPYTIDDFACELPGK